MRLTQTGSAVDALVVALAEPGGTILTDDRADIETLAAFADGVEVEVIGGMARMTDLVV